MSGKVVAIHGAPAEDASMEPCVSAEIRAGSAAGFGLVAGGGDESLESAIGLDAGGYAFPYIAGYADRKDGAAIITRLMNTIQKTAAVIIATIETRLLGEHTDSEEAEEATASPAFKRT